MGAPTRLPLPKPKGFVFCFCSGYVEDEEEEEDGVREGEKEGVLRGVQCALGECIRVSSCERRRRLEGVERVGEEE